jgi:hypothetical protein
MLFLINFYFLHIQLLRTAPIVWTAVMAGCVFEGSIVPTDIPVPGQAGTDIHMIPDSTTVSGSPGVNNSSDTYAPGYFPKNNDTDTSVVTSPYSSDSGTISPTTSTSETDSPDVDASMDSDTFTSVDTLTQATDSASASDTGTTADSFTFFTIADLQNGPATGVNHLKSMALLDSNAIALIEVGDFTHYGSESEWDAHMQALKDGAVAAGFPEDYYRTTATNWGEDYIRLIGVNGNHELWSSSWYSYWNKYLPGQKNLGVNSETQGVYFTLTYANTLFIVLDSNFSSPEQTKWLKEVLEGPQAQSATWKIAFFHEPVYPCNSKSPLSFGLPWVSLFEQHNVDLVVHGHAHTFEQTCPMKGGKCVPDSQHGVTYLTASGGGTTYLRAVNTSASGVVSYGNRTDAYECEEILADYESSWHHFCHYSVNACNITVRCYDHDHWDNGQLRHEFAITQCD